jgi:putative phosphoribosyl transferase
MNEQPSSVETEVEIQIEETTLAGTLTAPATPRGVVLFAHGSGSSRFSPRNRFVAGTLQRAGLATLLMDLLTEDEEAVDLRTRHLRFDIGLLTARLIGATDWLMKVTMADTSHALHDSPIGYFGSSTGAAAALAAAAERASAIGAVVSRGGRPDLASAELPSVRAPTLLIVGGDDGPVIGMNEEALALLHCEKRLEIVPGATHLFEEPGKLEEVARLASAWFVQHLSQPDTRRASRAA